MSVDLSIVIPCFNECENASLLVSDLANILPQAPCITEVIFADGGSIDGTPETLIEAITSHQLSNVTVLSLDPGGGYGRDIMRGLAEAQGTVLAWTHADLQTDLRDVFKAYSKYLEHSHETVFIKGKRKNRAMLEVFFTFGMQIIAFTALRTYLSDINAQPKLFHRKFYEQILSQSPPTDFSLDLYTYYCAKMNAYTVDTVDVFFANRRHGEAKGGGGSWKNRLQLIRRTNKYIWNLRVQMRSKNYIK